MSPTKSIHRRAFLSDVGMGFTGLALGAMLNRAGGIAGCVDSAERAAGAAAKS